MKMIKSKISITALAMALSLGSSSEEILAMKEGPFQKYQKCTLMETTGSLEINNSRHFKLLETSTYNNSFYNLDELVLPAIAGIQAPTYRWFPTQTNYFIKDSDGALINFFAFGYINVANDSAKAHNLVSQIDNLCVEQLHDFRIIGKFQIDLQIGDRLFEDYLEIKRTNNFHFLDIEGMYIVPNSFEAQLRSLVYRNGDFSFIIRVQERDDDYLAIFEGHLDQNGTLTGEAYVLPDRIKIGSFTGKKM